MPIKTSSNGIDRRRKHLLILECDSAKLAEQQMAVGTELEWWISKFFPSNPIFLVTAPATHDLLDDFAALADASLTFPTILVVGHSDEQGVQLTSDKFSSWEEFASWIRPFKPKKIILLACQAGKWLPCSTLFGGIPELNEIFASPVFATTNDKFLVFARILHILGARKEDISANQTLQLISWLLTGGIMITQTRDEYEECGAEHGQTYEWN